MEEIFLESTPVVTVNYLQFQYCIYDAIEIREDMQDTSLMHYKRFFKSLCLFFKNSNLKHIL